MEFRQGEETKFKKLLAPFSHDEKVLEMKKYIQHGKITTYDHCKSVSKLSFLINRRLHLGADEKSLTTGAFLHDFYLYDWHKDDGSREGLHGFTHANTAMENARERFHISDKEASIIKSHMWPLNITSVPNCREAWIVTIADKLVSAKETILCR